MIWFLMTTFKMMLMNSLAALVFLKLSMLNFLTGSLLNKIEIDLEKLFVFWTLGKKSSSGKDRSITNHKVRHKSVLGAKLLLLKQITIIQRCSIFFSSKFSRKKESAARQDLKSRLWYLFVLKNLKSLFSVQMFITKMVTLTPGIWNLEGFIDWEISECYL